MRGHNFKAYQEKEKGNEKRSFDEACQGGLCRFPHIAFFAYPLLLRCVCSSENISEHLVLTICLAIPPTRTLPSHQAAIVDRGHGIGIEPERRSMISSLPLLPEPLRF